jgi:SWI/SNF-related matrix-associated actin-dependent regulator 1 of chromatin subfamily A
MPQSAVVLAPPPTIGPALRIYQEEAIDWLTSSTSLNPNRFCIIDAGLGKTAIAITAAYECRAKSVLVLCPAIARIIWREELTKWSPRHHPPELLVVEPGTASRDTPIPRPGWVVVAYSNLSLKTDPWLKRLNRISWDLLIVDECQYLKQMSTNRTRAVYGAGGLATRAAKTWLLSATPAPNHVGELYPHLRGLFPEALPHEVKTVYDFENRFTNVQDTLYGRRISGSKTQAIPELRARLKPHVFRRRREEVLTDLPPIAFYDTPINADLGGADLGDGRVIPDDDDVLIDALQSHETQLATGRRTLGELKVPEAVAFCEELLDEMPVDRRKLVVFAYHRSVIRNLAAGLVDYHPVTIDGGTTQREREKAIRFFQMQGSTAQVLVGQIQAAGTAITLTSANTAIFVETSWTPAENYQAAMRIHRLGQINACTCHFLYVPGSLDQRIMHAFRRKASELASLFDTKNI